MSYAPTTWAPPPSRRDRFNAEEQHEFNAVASGVADYFEKRGELMPAAITHWMSVGDERYALMFSDGSEWRVDGHVCCQEHPWRCTSVERVGAS